jgi:hypothetical protein
MSIADEIKEVLQEVGSAIVIRKPIGTEISGEFIDSNDHAEHTNPNIRAFFYDLNLHSPTSAEIGDTLIYGVAPFQVEILLTVIAPQMFENQVVEYLASGYVVNTKGAFWQYDQDGEANEANDFDPVPGWSVVYPGIEIHGTIMDRLYRSMVKQIADDSMDVAVEKLQLFISDHFVGVKMGMQWRSVDGRVYRVEHIEDHNFVGIRVVFLAEENRP